MGDVAGEACGEDAAHDSVPLDLLGVVEFVAAGDAAGVEVSDPLDVLLDGPDEVSLHDLHVVDVVEQLDDLCSYSAHIGLKAVDLLQPEEYSVPARYGLVCSMGYAGGGDIRNALNRLENHAGIEAAFRQNIPLAAKAGVPNVITFSGNRNGMSDEEGARNTVIGLNRLKKIAEDNNVTICMELLNSKIDHPGYMCDHTAWGVSVARGVNSPRFQLLYDIYHMQMVTP